MKALPLLTELLRQGVKFKETNGKLNVTTPKGVALSDTLKNEIRAHREEILTRLRAPRLSTEEVTAVFPGASIISDEVMDLFFDPDMEVCFRCDRQRWWVSTFGIRVCEKCFPPSAPSVVVSRIEPAQHDAA